MNTMKSMLLASYLVMGMMFCAYAEVPSGPPAGLQDLGLDATVEFGSVYSEPLDVDKEFLLKTGARKLGVGFAFSTNNKEPWFIVTLKSPADIKTIYIQNRLVSCQERAKGLTVSVSNDQKTWKKIWEAGDVAPEWTIDLTTPEKAQYIKFELPVSDAGFLHLNNVRIYGN